MITTTMMMMMMIIVINSKNVIHTFLWLKGSWSPMPGFLEQCCLQSGYKHWQQRELWIHLVNYDWFGTIHYNLYVCNYALWSYSLAWGINRYREDEVILWTQIQTYHLKGVYFNYWCVLLTMLSWGKYYFMPFSAFSVILISCYPKEKELPCAYSYCFVPHNGSS